MISFQDFLIEMSENNMVVEKFDEIIRYNGFELLSFPILGGDDLLVNYFCWV